MGFENLNTGSAGRQSIQGVRVSKIFTNGTELVRFSIASSLTKGFQRVDLLWGTGSDIGKLSIHPSNSGALKLCFYRKRSVSHFVQTSKFPSWFSPPRPGVDCEYTEQADGSVLVTLPPECVIIPSQAAE